MSNLFCSIASLVLFISSQILFICSLTRTGWSFVTIVALALMAITLVYTCLFLGMYFMNVKYK